jgi:DNA gyrase subunit A
MPLRRLAALERKKIDEEYKELLKQIQYLEGLLKSPKKILDVIKTELTELKETYGTPRRTLIVDQTADKNDVVTARDVVPEESVVVAVAESGKICWWPTEDGLDPARGRQKDPLVVAAPANTRYNLYLFTTDGKAVIIPMHQVPKGAGPGDGPNLTEFSLGAVEQVVAGVALPPEEAEGYLFLVTRQGRVKRVTLQDLTGARGSEAVVIGIEKGDALLTAFVTPGEGEVMLVSSAGQAIRFAEEEVRAMGLPAAGVWGMKLAKDDEIVGAGPVKTRGELVIVTANGFGKRTDLDQFPKQGRHGQGVIALPVSKETGPVAAAGVINLSNRVMLISKRKNSKTVYGRAFSKAARTSKGKSVMSVPGTDGIAALIVLEV